MASETSPRSPVGPAGTSARRYGSTESGSSILHGGAFDLSVMQLNAWLIPVRPGFPGCLDFQAFNRAKRMGLWLEEQAMNKRLDIAIFQEVWTPWRSFVACTIHSAFCCSLFGRHFIENSLSKVLPYYTRIHGSRPCDCTKRFFDSGLVIASRYPIIDETFKIYPSGSPHDALSSKGILVAAIQRPDDKGIIIVGSSHLDAGDDDSFKISQLGIAIETIKQFTLRIQARCPEAPVIATLFGSDMNIDGKEFWSDSNSYAEAKRILEALGMKDSWLLTQRTIPPEPDACYNPDQHPELGITSDQHDCVKRLDYIWVCPGPIGEGYFDSDGASAPPQHEMSSNISMSRRGLKKFGVKAKTELNDGVLWRSSKSMRIEMDKAVKEGDASIIRKLAAKIDRHDREMRLSDHAAVFAKLHFFPHV